MDDDGTELRHGIQAVHLNFARRGLHHFAKLFAKFCMYLQYILRDASALPRTSDGQMGLTKSMWFQFKNYSCTHNLIKHRGLLRLCVMC